MSWFSNFFSKLFKRKKNTTDWASLNFGKPSTAGDDFRKNNEV